MPPLIDQLALPGKDVFVVFSKRQDTEAALALALKDGLERLGLFAFEYEDWNWFADASEVPDHDRLARMFEDSKAVVVIAPRTEQPSAGVQVELDLLARQRHPAVIGIAWPETAVTFFDGLSLAHRATAAGTADWYLENFSESLSELCWISCALGDCFRAAPREGGLLLEAAAAGSMLLANLRQARAHSTREIASATADHSTTTELRRLHHWWYGGAADVTQALGTEAGFEVVRTAAVSLHQAADAYCAAARRDHPELEELPPNVIKSRALMRSRLEGTAAIDDLTTAAERSVDALAHADYVLTRGMVRLADGDLSGAITDFENVIAKAGARAGAVQWKAIAGTAYHNLAVTQSGQRDHPAAVASYTRAIEAADARSPEFLMYTSYRAINRYRAGDEEGALADYAIVIGRPGDAPRAEAQARLNRGAILFERGDLEGSVQDWEAVVDLADATVNQKLKALMNSGDALAQLGKNTQAIGAYTRALRDPRLPHALREDARQKIDVLQGGLQASL